MLKTYQRHLLNEHKIKNDVMIDEVIEKSTVTLNTTILDPEVIRKTVFKDEWLDFALLY